MAELLAGGLWLVGAGLIVAGIVLVIVILAAVRGVRSRREDPSTNKVDLESTDREPS